MKSAASPTRKMVRLDVCRHTVPAAVSTCDDLILPTTIRRRKEFPPGVIRRKSSAVRVPTFPVACFSCGPAVFPVSLINVSRKQE